MNRLIVVAVAAGIAGSPDNAVPVHSYFDGNVLYESGLVALARGDQQANGLLATTYRSYVFGVIDTLSVGREVCIPKDLSPATPLSVVLEFLRDHPETRDQGAAGLAAEALIAKFPCPKPGPPKRAPKERN